ncbi:MAG TPA: hypothetical protein VGO94_15115 [Mycobacteriales bacterium]|jgi:hypothetical protein|nr:hypothetical protein [Cryptosporangiaceae bacterium]MDQ1677491.1 hypothetical protein [Actinomycetota bacterium]HEV7757184.1 hypothetical protein [Mycobacteriales bacterium]
MALETELLELARALGRLRDSWREVVVTVTEDRPGDLAAAEGLCDTLVDGLGEIEDALNGLAPLDGPALVAASYGLRAVRDRYYRELRAADRAAALRRSLDPHGPAWRAWHHAVRTGLDRCEPGLRTAEDALLRCWREVLEAAPTPTVRVPTSR